MPEGGGTKALYFEAAQSETASLNTHTPLGNARAIFDNGDLIVSNPLFERRWRWTGKGFVTTRVASIQTGTVWTREETARESDWLLPGYDHAQSAALTDLDTTISDDEGFTSEHIRVVATMTYPDACLALRFSVWVYPEAPGIRTQLSVRALEGYSANTGDAAIGSHHRLNFAPLDFSGLQRRMFGYYNETQQRNDTCEDILKEAVIAHPLKNREFHTWPSVLCLENECEGLAVVKESHKCPNQVGYDCGLFLCDADRGLSNLGWGITPRDIVPDWRQAWADWWMVYSNEPCGRERALKAFDAARYPLDPARDVYVQANTWGSGVDGEGSRLAATEKAVLKELDSCADLGIDILQIDDGWQVVPGHNTWKPEPENGWHPHPESYPEGWGPVKARAEALGMKLGLWAAAVPVSLEELAQNAEQGGFATFKLDFAQLRRTEEIHALMQKVRTFIKRTDPKVRVNWDVTEVSRRYGYFFAREFGCLYLANRKPICPPSTTYRPHAMLRDLWQLSHYINLRKIQGSVQNIDRVNPQLSDANLHTHDYCVAITLMSTPLFFQQTVYYTEAARKQIRPLLAAYKPHQAAIMNGTVFPIGAKPDNYSWTGFQSHDAERGAGFLTLFRELNNEVPTAELDLRFVANRTLTLTDLMSGAQRTVHCGADGNVAFTCEDAPGYRFLKYE